MSGRGAWNNEGRGGTISFKRTGPGPYYALSVEPLPQVGTFTTDDLSHRAVHYGVIALQRGLNRQRKNMFTPLLVDGLYGRATALAAIAWQKSLPVNANVIPWGGFGPDSVKALLVPLLKDLAGPVLYPVCYGLIQSESGWDVGAVGTSDATDRGLAQINQESNPDITEQDCFKPGVAFTYISDKLHHAIEVFDGDTRTAVASYNLGIAGASAWKKAGSPDLWAPAGSTTKRNLRRYIDTILSASL